MKKQNYLLVLLLHHPNSKKKEMVGLICPQEMNACQIFCSLVKLVMKEIDKECKEVVMIPGDQEVERGVSQARQVAWHLSNWFPVKQFHGLMVMVVRMHLHLYQKTSSGQSLKIVNKKGNVLVSLCSGYDGIKWGCVWCTNYVCGVHDQMIYVDVGWTTYMWKCVVNHVELSSIIFQAF